MENHHAAAAFAINFTMDAPHGTAAHGPRPCLKDASRMRGISPAICGTCLTARPHNAMPAACARLARYNEVCTPPSKPEPDSRSSCPLNILPGGRDRLVLPLAQRVPILLALAKLADGTTFSKL